MLPDEAGWKAAGGGGTERLFVGLSATTTDVGLPVCTVINRRSMSRTGPARPASEFLSHIYLH